MMMHQVFWKLGPALLLGLPLWTGLMACGAGSFDSDDDSYGTQAPAVDTESGSPGDDDDTNIEDGNSAPTPPPEQENAYYRAEPAATDRFVFVVNPDRDTITKIEAESRAVYTLPVENHPTQVLAGAQDPNKVVVVNEGSATLSIIAAQTDDIQSIDIHQDTNYMALSSDGLYAVTYFNAQVENADTDVNGVRSYSSLSVVFTGSAEELPTSTPMAVALNPRDVTFIPATDQALVLCDDALALIDLSPEPTSRLIQLTNDIDERIEVAELKVGPDGRYAFLRLTTIPELVIVDLQAPADTQAVDRITLESVPTDLDIAGDEVILVDRSNRALLIYSSTDPYQEPFSIATPENQLVGSVLVAPENSQAILYTTLRAEDLEGTSEEGMPLDRFSVWDLDTYDIQMYGLVKSVASVSLNRNPDIQVATFQHHGEASSDVDSFDGQEAFSQFYFDDGLVVPVVLEAPIKALASSRSEAYQFMILEDNLNVAVVDFLTRQVSSVAVQSRPVFVGMLTGTETAYVSQEHDLGRISFVDPVTLEATTITGFELNSQD